MKIDKIKMGATIPVQQYGNIMPEIEISDVELQEGSDMLLGFMGEMFAKYSEKGGLSPKDLAAVVLSKYSKKSFNEEGVEIEFEPIAHTYTYKDKKLTGATDYIKRFYKPFDEETISSVLESKWGVPQQVIKDLWKQNGELTSSFGTVVHKTLEFYDKFMSYGQIISSQQKVEENYCLPKHPILREIVKGFIAMKKPEGIIVPEALVSNVAKGLCGHADRITILDQEKKICRVGDYKININSEEVDKSNKVLAPFDMLPSTKLSKYQLQLSIYANILEDSGWTVEGLDVWVYESEWKHFELPVLKVI